MKTFDDLKFRPHGVVPNGKQAIAGLGKGIKISVVAGEGPRMSLDEAGKGNHGLYNDDNTYEVAVFDRDEMAALSSGDDVIGWQSPEEVTELMKEIQRDPELFREKCAARKAERDALWAELQSDD